MKRVDLHIHTAASDSDLSPSVTVQKAIEAGLSAIAITDHDTVSGYEEAVETAAEQGIEIIPGIEFSTKYGGRVHILGYYIDPDNAELKQALKGIISDRDHRNEICVQLLRQDGISITYDQMKEHFGEVIGKPHFADILVQNGICSSIEEGFTKFLNKGMKYFVPRRTIPVETCINLIRGAGGVAVLAHPFEYSYSKISLPDLLEKCIEFGVEGLECRHSSHSAGEMAYLETLADEYGLLKTGGSDFHGGVKPNVNIGNGNGIVSVPYRWLEELQDHIKNSHR